VFAWRDAITLLIVLAVSLSVVASIDNAGWVEGMPPLYPIALFGVASGYVLARLPWRAVFIYPLALLVGASGLLVQVLAVTPGDDLKHRCGEMVLRMRLWLDALTGGGISNDALPVIILFLVLVWLATSFLAWSVFRWRNPWAGLVPGGLALLINISYLPGQTSPAFIVFVIASVLLVARTHLEARMTEWRRSGTSYPGSLHFFSLNQTVWAALVLVGAAWLIPVAGQAGPLPSIWRAWTNPVADRFTGLSRVFSAVEGRKGMPLDRYASFLPYRGYFGAVDGPIMTVKTSRPVLLRAAVYDVYTSGGWKAGERDKQPLQVDAIDLPAVLGQAASQYRQPVAIEVTVQQSLPVFVAPGEPLIVNQEADVETGGDASNVTALRPTKRLAAGDTYTVVGLVSTASADALDASGGEPPSYGGYDRFSQLRGDYPTWVTDRYLQLPDNLPSSILRLAENVTNEFHLTDTSPYTKARVIQDYLRTFPVEMDEEPPPSNVDAVAYFLFQKQRGHPLYHASAMVVLLRTLGVPARLAVGFALPENSGNVEGVYTVDAANAYAWSEVYFVGLGWIPFNPARASGAGNEPMSPADTWESYPANPISTQDLLNMFPTGANNAMAPEEQGTVPPASKPAANPVLPWLVAWSLAVVMLALAAIAGLRYAWNRSVAGLSHPAQIFEKTRRLSAWAGVGPRPSQTPREFLGALHEEVPDAPEVSLLADAYERVEFGQKPLEPGENVRLDAIWGSLRPRLLKRMLRRRGGRR
jgi:hypothetical protein